MQDVYEGRAPDIRSCAWLSNYIRFRAVSMYMERLWKPQDLIFSNVYKELSIKGTSFLAIPLCNYKITIILLRSSDLSCSMCIVSKRFGGYNYCVGLGLIHSSLMLNTPPGSWPIRCQSMRGLVRNSNS